MLAQWHTNIWQPLRAALPESRQESPNLLAIWKPVRHRLRMADVHRLSTSGNNYHDSAPSTPREMVYTTITDTTTNIKPSLQTRSCLICFSLLLLFFLDTNFQIASELLCCAYGFTSTCYTSSTFDRFNGSFFAPGWCLGELVDRYILRNLCFRDCSKCWH